MSNSAGTTDIPSQDMELDNSKKTDLLGTNQSSTKLKILQWNARGLSSAKMTELKQITTQNDTDLLIINKANTTAENAQHYNIKNFTTYTLFKARQRASGIDVTVRNNLKSDFKNHYKNERPRHSRNSENTKLERKQEIYYMWHIHPSWQQKPMPGYHRRYLSYRSNRRLRCCLPKLGL
jgi:hypothetical protein